MQKRNIILLIIVICCTLLMPASTIGAAAVKATSVEFAMNFDGKRLKLPEDQHVFVVNGTSYVPIRFIAYALQKSVAWDTATATVSVSEPGKKEQIMLEEYLLNLTIDANSKSTIGGIALTPVPKAVHFLFYNEQKKLPSGQSGYIVNGSLYVPVRFMAESIGTAIHWDPVMKQISGKSQAYLEEEKAAAENKSQQSDNEQESVREGQGNAQSGVTPPGGTPVAGGGVGGGAKPSQASIEAAAEAKLVALQNSCESNLMSIGLSYASTEDSVKKQELVAQGQSALDSCTADFNNILAETESQLQANGYPTDILAAFRAEFEEQLAAGRIIMEELAK